MQEPTHIRVLSLTLALAVVVGGWLSFEYSAKRSDSPDTPIADVNQHPAVNPAPYPPSVPPLPQATPYGLHTTYKCQNGTRISYSDHPCSAAEKLLTVTTTTQSPEPTNLEQLRQRAAVMAASQEPQAKTTVAAAVVLPPSLSTSMKEARCLQIDAEIANIDAQLRQPHNAQWGDYLSGERKKRMDERFSLGC